jgi:hypothetical protein
LLLFVWQIERVAQTLLVAKTRLAATCALLTIVPRGALKIRAWAAIFSQVCVGASAARG